MKLSIIIPAYNEEKRIKRTLECLVDRFNGSCEILIVSESTDKTDDIVTEFSKNSAVVKLITSNRRLGKGGAFKKGVENSQGKIVMLLDSDLPVPISDVEKVVSWVGENVDVAVASREVEGTKILVYPPLARVFAGKAFSRIFNALFNLNVKDTQCGCKAFKKEVLENVLYTVESNGFEFDAELLFKCKRMGYRIKEIPVTWSYKPDSKLNLFKDTLKMGKGCSRIMGENLHSHAEDLERIEESDFWSKVKVKLILNLVEGKNVLDVGCGSGRLSKTLLEKGYSVMAIDNDWKAVEIAKKKGIMAFVSDINDWQTAEKFDCIILGDVLEHIEDDKSAMRKVHGMLTPNGCIVVNVPAYQVLFGKHDVALGHERRYSNKELKTKLKDSGFTIESMRHWNLLALPITIYIKLSKKDYPHERVSNIKLLSKLLEKWLLAESKINYWFGISILCKARK